MHNVTKYALFSVVGATCFTAEAQISNQTEEKGELISHAGNEMGRLAIIDTLGDYIITIPEQPSSPPGSDFEIRAWDISDPSNPVEVARFGPSQHPFNAHGTIKRGNQIYIGDTAPDDGIFRNTLELNDEGGIDYVVWSGPEGSNLRSGMFRPWSATSYWSYRDSFNDAQLQLDGEVTATWDHLGDTGVIGFAMFMGDLLIYGSDQSKSGVATYDISDPSNPVLLDVLNQPAIHPTILDRRGNPVEWGIGGYWSEIHGHYTVFSRRGANPGVQVVDFSDPSNLSVHCEFFPRDPKWGVEPVARDDFGDPMYVGFQDEYVFAERYKLNIETCELDLVLDEIGKGVETSQYARPIGNLVLTGGMGNWQIDGDSSGLGIWAHQVEPDTRAPYVAYHIPQVDRVNYPVMAPISLMIPETLRSETIIPGETLTITEVGGETVEIDYVLSHTGMLTVDPIEYLKENTTYEVRLVGIQDMLRNEMAEYTFRFSTGATLDGGPVEPENNAPEIEQFTVAPSLTVDTATNVAFSVQASDIDGDALEYRYNFGDSEAGYGPWTTSSSASHTFTAVGTYRVNAQVRDNQSAVVLASQSVTVLEETSGPSDPTNTLFISSQVACDVENNHAWAVNPDNDTVTQILGESRTNNLEFAVADKPQNIALDASGNLWVTARNADSVNVYQQDGTLVATINTGYGSSPYGIVLNAEGTQAYVSLYGAGEVIQIDTATRQEVNRLALGATPAALAISPDGATLLATRFISGLNWGEVWQINTADLSLQRTIRLDKDTTEDTLSSGRGVPNYLAAIAIHPNGEKAYVVGKKDNVDRSPILWRGIDDTIDLDDDNSVRTFLATIDLQTGEESDTTRVDFDNADSPSAMTFSGNGEYLFVSLQGNNQVITLDIFTHAENLPSIAGAPFNTGLAPQGLCFNSQTNQLFSKNLTDRTVTVMELENFINGGNVNIDSVNVSTVNNETMPADVLAGKAAFYNASDERMSAEGYISCATCHVDGGHDGRTFDFTGRGEGLRNTTSLLGRGGTRFGDVHWSANFDEIQDFEHDMRGAFLGSGFLTEEQFALADTSLGAQKAGMNQGLDNLAAYVSSLNKASLPKSPYRTATGELTEQAVAGQTLFSELNCSSCHRGNAFTDGVIHDVGTLRTYSGNRLGESLSGIKTPSLLGVFASAPYLHDGSAATLADVFTAVGGTVYQAEDATINGTPGTISAPEYLRESNGVALQSAGETELVFTAVDGASGGNGFIRLRYAGGLLTESSDTTISITVNNETQTVELQPLSKLANGAEGNYAETAGIPITFAEDTNNTITITYSGGTAGDSIIIDDLTVSHVDDVALAQSHTVANQLTDSEREALVQYLLQIDTQSAPEDDEVVELGVIEEPVDNAPSAPQNLTVEFNGLRGFLLTWETSTDDTGIAHYQIYKNGNLYRTTSSLSTNDGWAPVGETEYYIVAIDTDDNASAPSEVVIGNMSPNSISFSAEPIVETRGVLLSWEFSDPSLHRFDIYRDGERIRTVYPDGSANYEYRNNWLDLRTEFRYQVNAVNADGETIARSFQLTLTAGDSEAPTQPADFNVVFNGEGGFNLSWQASTDNVRIAAYQIYQDGEIVGQTESTTFKRPWVSVGEHTYYVVAHDGYGNYSEPSESVTVTMAPRSVSIDADPVIATRGVALTWSAELEGVSNYHVYRDGELVRSLPADSTSFTDNWLSLRVEYRFQVNAVDANGETIARSHHRTLMAGDSTPPSAPSNVIVTYNGGRGFQVSWDASQDESEINYYQIYRNGEYWKHTSEISIHDHWAPADEVSYHIIAVDVHKNVSEPSEAVTGVRP